MKAPFGWTLGLVLCALAFLVIGKAADDGWLKAQSKQPHTLKIALRESNHELGSLYEEHGFDRDLFEAFARDRGYKTEYIPMPTTQEALESLKKGETNAALGVQSALFKGTLLQSPAYSKIQPLIACRSGVAFKKLYDKGMLSILLPEDLNLQNAAKIAKKLYPRALFLQQKNLNVGSALVILHEKKIDCTLTQERLFKIYKLAYPRMQSPAIIGAPVGVSAYFTGKSWQLRNEFESWLQSKTARIELDSLKEKYFGFFEIFDAFEVEMFEKRIESRLRKFIPYFKEAERKYGIAWETLAAIAYQESQWDASAKSFTGVRGIMMLTKTTAQEMGVSNRVDPRRSILGGAAYLKKLIDRMPKGISEHEKLFFALASYNVGFGHVKDAQTLAASSAESLSWHTIKTKLPLLSKQNVYRKLRHGKARGKEPVLYVQRIRKFQKLLSLAFPSEETVRSNSIWADNTKDTNTTTARMN